MKRINAWLKTFTLFSPENVHRLAWLGFALLFLGVFVSVTWELREDSELDSFDQRVLILISSLRSFALNGPMVDVTALGSFTVITLFTLIGILLLWLNQDRRGCVFLAVGSLGSGIGTAVMKRLFTRERPSVVPRLVEVDGFSYPSGHSLAATSLYLLILFLSWQYYPSWRARLVLSCAATLIICGIGFSRLYLGVHYPSDVLSGTCLGAAWVFLLTAYFSRTKNLT